MGLGTRTWDSVVNSLRDDCNITLWSVSDKVPLYKQLGFQIEGPKVYIYTGIRRDQVTSEDDTQDEAGVFSECKDDDIPMLLGYDTYINGDDRQDYITRHLKSCESVVMAIDQNDVAGYGALEKKNEVYCIAPLYANDKCVARAILKMLLDKIPLGYSFAANVMMSNPVARDLFQNVDKGPDSEIVLMFSRQTYPYRQENVYVTYGAVIGNV